MAKRRRRKSKNKLSASAKKFLFICFGSLVVALIAGYVYVQVNDSGIENTVDTFDDEDISYDQLRDTGSLSQLTTLLMDLRNERSRSKLMTVAIDTDRKIVEIADAITSKQDCTEENRVLAAQSKLKALASSYELAIINGLKDPFVAEQLIGTAGAYLDDKNQQVSREAHLARTTGLVTETIYKRFLGGFDKVKEAMVDLVSLFPDDPFVIARTKELFTRLRAFDAEASVKVAAAIAEITSDSSFKETKELARFMKDIILLFDTGIGNFQSIGSITVDDSDFMARMNKLNSDIDSGPTVVRQLDNGIDYFERNGNYELARQLSQNILDQAGNRSHERAAELAKISGQNGLLRNALPGSIWNFDGLDFFGNALNTKRFEKQVILIVFYSAKDQKSLVTLKSVLGTARQLVGRNFETIMVEIGDENTVPLAAANQHEWVAVRSNIDAPHNYLKQCPILRFPYGLLIDKKGNVDSINITFNTVKTRIEYLLSLE